MRIGVLVALVLSVALPGAAQERDPVRDLLPEGESELDPIGTGDTHTLRDVPPPMSNEPPEDPTLGPEPPGVASQQGEILWAIPGVRETDHRTDVRLVDGFALVTEEMQLISRARHRAEVRYRLPVPEGAVPTSLEVCREDRCRVAQPGGSHAYFDSVRATPSDDETLPIAHVDRESGALIVRAAPVAQGAPTRVKVQWLAPARVRGGVARLRIPARGNDLRAVASSVTVSADGLLAPSLQSEPMGVSPVRIDPWVDIDVAARARSGGGAALRVDTFDCGDQRCARVRASAGPRAGRRGDYVLLIDASPSTFGPARGRIGAALAALVASMPSGSTVRAIAFAGRAETLVGDAVAPSDFPLASVARATTLELGSATRPESAWSVMRRWGRDLHAIVVGDGGVTTGSALDRAMGQARRAGMRISVLNVADRTTVPALRALAARMNGAVVDAGAPADEASRGRSTQRLEEALLPILAPRVAREVVVRDGGQSHRLGPLYAGEELVWEGVVRGRLLASAGNTRARAPRRPDAERPWLAAWGRGIAGEVVMSAVHDADRSVPSRDDCHPRGPASRAGGVSAAGTPVALAEPLTCGPSPRVQTPASPALGRGVPAETLLQMLRSRIVPVARGCFRRDRAGRVDYSTRATFRFRLADREIAEAEIEGEISPELRTCLMSAVDTLEVPRFEGAVVVRYPLYTERAERAPRVEIEREVLHAVDRIAGDEPTTPSAP